jgi:hypothetical protein
MPYLTWYDADDATSPTGTVNTEYTARITVSRADARAIYVDWDDGESNKKDQANYQWVEISEPKSSFDVSHTYNKSGTFNPVVQVINSDGFASRYYSNETDDASGNNDEVVPFTRKTAVSGVQIDDTTSTGILRIENTTVKSGIDNTIFEKDGPRLIYLQCPPTLTSTELGYAGTIKIQLEMEIANSSTNVTEILDGKVSTGYSSVIRVQTVDLTSPSAKTGLHSFIDAGVAVKRVLSVKYLNPKITGTYANDYTRNAALNNLKIFVVAIDDEDLIVPITYVSAGSPIKKAENMDRNIVMDFSQSRAAASNVSSRYYFYDNGKGWFNNDPWGESSSKFTNATRQTGSTKQVAYTYTPRLTGIGGYANTGATGKFTRPFGTGSTDSNAKWVYAADQAERCNQFSVDDFGRFYDIYHLTRNSMEPSSSANNVSSISGNKVTIARITPILNFSSQTKATKFDITGTSGVYSADYSTAAFNNVASNATGRVSLSGCNTQVFTDAANAGAADRIANEYLLALWDAKTNKIFFQCSPWWSGSTDRLAGTDISDGIRGLKIAGLSYLRATDYQTIKQELEWVPLEFEDTTASTTQYRDTGDDEYKTLSSSFTKPGFVSFDMPLDWHAIEMEDLYGGTMTTTTNTYNPVNIPNKSTDIGGSYTTAKFLVTCSAVTSAYTAWGKGLVVTGAAISGAMDDIGVNNVGAFKYIAEIVTDDGNDIDGQNLWLAKITGNGVTEYTGGWDGDDEIYLHFGVATGSNYVEPTAGDVYEIIVKRINFYDVLPGNSKVKKIGTQFTPVDAGVASKFPNNYGFNDYTAGIAYGLKNAWKDKSKYPLLITLSGNTADVGTTDYVSPEIWNVLDATEGHVSLIKEIDDTAYNLNSVAITSDLSIGRSANYFKAITRKGKVFVVKTGVNLSSVGFTSVALGDENSASAFDDHGPSTLYGHLHTIRRLQAESVSVYWDEPQKDGTYVRFWGTLTDVTETRSTGGPRAVMSYSFNMTIQEVALLDTGGILMTDKYPLGGILDEQHYT